MLLSFAMIVFFIAQSGDAAKPITLEGWRLPGDAEMVNSWAKFRDLKEKPFHIRADFNGDGLLDDAYLALSTKRTGWALFVNLNSKSAKPRIVKLAEDTGRNVLQSMGLSEVNAGKYQTACGKGYWTCKADEARELTLRFPAINLFAFEGASVFFWWDEKSGKFQQTWISD